MASKIPAASSERRAFWMYWTSTTTSYLGDGIRFVALPLLAATLTRGFGTAFGVATGRFSLALLVVFAFTLSIGEVFYDIALHSYLPALVPEAMLQRANSRLVTAETVVFEFAGPAAGGFLFARITALPFFADAAAPGRAEVPEHQGIPADLVLFFEEQAACGAFGVDDGAVGGVGEFQHDE